MKIYPISLLMPFCFPVCLLYREFQCPSTPERRLRAKWFCQKFGLKEENYACLYDPLLNEYQEKCNFKANILDPGEKYILNHRPTSAKCDNANRYQPFGLQQFNDQCIYRRSKCSEPGQVRFNDGSATVDKSCRCNGAHGYAFVISPVKRCYCTPSTEDCSCYLKRCAENFTLSLDYQCIHMSNTSYDSLCPGMNIQEGTSITATMGKGDLPIKSFEDPKYNRVAPAVFILCCIVSMVVISCLLQQDKMPPFCYEQLSPPTNLKAHPKNGSLQLTWSSPVQNQLKVESFKILYTHNGWVDRTTFSVNANELFCIIPNVLPMKTYRFKISSCLRNLDGKLSDEHFYVTEKPEKPHNLKYLFGNKRNIRLVWTAPAEVLFKTESYDLEITLDDWKNKSTFHLPASKLEYDINNFTVDAMYRFKLYTVSHTVRSYPTENVCDAKARYYVKIQLNGIVHKDVLHDKTSQPYIALQEGIKQGVNEIFSDCPGDNVIAELHFSRGSLYAVFILLSKRCNDEAKLRNAFEKTIKTGKFGKFLVSMEGFVFKALDNPVPPQCVRVETVNTVINVTWEKPPETFFEAEHYLLQSTADDSKTYDEVLIPADQYKYCISNVLSSTMYKFKMITVAKNGIQSLPSDEVCIVTKGYKLSTGVVATVKSSVVAIWKTTLNSNLTTGDDSCRSEESQKSKFAGAQVMYSKEDVDSSWLFEVINKIGFTKAYRTSAYRTVVFDEIMQNFGKCDNSFNVFCFGFENFGSHIFGLLTATDCMYCFENNIVVEELQSVDQEHPCLLIVCDPVAAAGYVNLQIVVNGKPLTTKDMDKVGSSFNRVLKADSRGRLVVKDSCDLGTILINSHNEINYKGTTFVDKVFSYHCRTWKIIATEWLSRKRPNEWPSESTIKTLASLGFILVKNDHPQLKESDLEWRVSFVLQKRLLLSCFNDIQYKCYVLLQIVNRELIIVDSISSCHWQTCMFYAIENNNTNIWKPERLFYCFTKCIRLMLSWVKAGNCPDYFVPEENMFKYRWSNNVKELTTNTLVSILNGGVDILKEIRAYHISLFISIGERRWRQHYPYYENHLEDTTHFVNVISAFNNWYHSILPSIFCHRIHSAENLLYYLWQTVYELHSFQTLSTYKQEDTDKALRLLKPYIFTCLSSCICSIAITCKHPKARAFLLAGSFEMYFRAGFSIDYFAGRLKFISILYTLGLYNDCAMYFKSFSDYQNTHDLPMCGCRYRLSYSQIDFSCFDYGSCISFLPLELPIVPEALKYEIFRYWDKQSNLQGEESEYQLNYKACVDCSVYMYYLKYILYKKLKKSKHYRKDAMFELEALLYERNVNHRETGFNLLAWMSFAENEIPKAFHYLKISLDISQLQEITNTGKRQYKTNSANLHVLVFLYKILCTKRHQSNFCYECLRQCYTLEMCSTCKIAEYCSRECQEKNLNNHKQVCELLKSF